MKMNEIKEIPEKDFEEYGKGIESTKQDELDANEMMKYDDIPPQEPGLGGIYSLFGKVMSQDDTRRICNLSKEELGTLPFTVRGSLYVARLAYSFGHKVFGGFFEYCSGIIQETSLSKDGYLISTFVTSKRFATATKEPGEQIAPVTAPKKKWGMFNRK
jgi:hypothetical protein